MRSCLTRANLRYFLSSALAIVLSFTLPNWACGQTTSTGAVTGLALDASGAVVQSATVNITKMGGGEVKSTTTDEMGRFWFVLTPGRYELTASKTNFQT